MCFCALTIGECEMIAHIKNRGGSPFPEDAWMMVAPLTVRISALAYLETVILQDLVSIVGE